MFAHLYKVLNKLAQETVTKLTFSAVFRSGIPEDGATGWKWVVWTLWGAPTRQGTHTAKIKVKIILTLGMVNSTRQELQVTLIITLQKIRYVLCNTRKVSSSQWMWTLKNLKCKRRAIKKMYSNALELSVTHELLSCMPIRTGITTIFHAFQSWCKCLPQSSWIIINLCFQFYRTRRLWEIYFQM